MEEEVDDMHDKATSKSCSELDRQVVLSLLGKTGRAVSESLHCVERERSSIARQ